MTATPASPATVHRSLGAAGIARRQVRPIVWVRAIVNIALLTGLVVAMLTGLVVWLAPDGRGAGEAIIGFLTKRGWADLHTAASLAMAAAIAIHLTVNRRALQAAVRLLATGRRS